MVAFDTYPTTRASSLHLLPRPAREHWKTKSCVSGCGSGAGRGLGRRGGRGRRLNICTWLYVGGPLSV